MTVLSSPTNRDFIANVPRPQEMFFFNVEKNIFQIRKNNFRDDRILQIHNWTIGQDF